MKHVHFDMTFTALSKRADEAVLMDDMATQFGTEDYREIMVFLLHEQSERRGEYRLESKEVIGVALIDLDDMFAAAEVLDRNQAIALFGREWIEDRESMQ